MFSSSCQTTRQLCCNSWSPNPCMLACASNESTPRQSAAVLTAAFSPRRHYTAAANRPLKSAPHSLLSPALQRPQPVRQSLDSTQLQGKSKSQPQYKAGTFQANMNGKEPSSKSEPSWSTATFEPCLHLLQQGQVPQALKLLQQLISQHAPPERDVGDTILLVCIHAPAVHTLQNCSVASYIVCHVCLVE